MDDKPYPRSHVTLIMGLNMLSVVVGLALAATPFVKGWYPGGFDTMLHVSFGMLIFTLAAFRALLGYGAIWLDVLLIALGVIIFSLPRLLHMQWNTAYTTAHMIGGAILVGVAIVSMLMTIPVNRRLRTAH